MSIWRDSTQPLILPEGKRYFEPVFLMVEPGTGDVQVQFLRSDDTTWYTPADADYTLSVEGAVSIDRQNAPLTKIIATGNAKFRLIGENL